jgi:hypothetical protein
VIRSYDWLIEACVNLDYRTQEIAARTAARAQEIAACEDTALRLKIDRAHREAFFQAAEALLESSPGSICSRLGLFIPRLLLHWHHAPDRAVAILSDLGEQAVLLALQGAATLPAGMQISLLRLVGDLGISSPEALDFVRRGLASRKSTIRAEAAVAEAARRRAFALDKIEESSAGAVSALIELLADEDALLRLKAAGALEKIGPAAAKAVPALEHCVKDESRFVREAARRAINAIGGTGSR